MSSIVFNVAADKPIKDHVISSQAIILWFSICSFSSVSDWDRLIIFEHPDNPGRIFCSIPTCHAEKNNPIVKESIFVQ